MMMASMASIDRSIVNVSLPAIREDFGVGLNEIEWVVTAYMLSFLLVLPLMNWLKSTIGYYRLTIASLSVFTLGSLMCSQATDLWSLIFFRIVQAAAGGIMTPMSMAILSETLPREEKGSAIAWWGIGNVGGLAVGPTLGGLLGHYFGWSAIFYINLPLGIFCLAMTVRYLAFLTEVPLNKVKFDYLGYVFFACFILSVQAWGGLLSRYPPSHASTWVMLAAAAFFLSRYIRSARQPNALLDLGVFRYSLFNRASIVIFIRSIALFGGMFYLPFLLQGELGYTELQTGLLMLPNAVFVLLTRPLAGRMADKGKIRDITMWGIALVALSFVLFAQIGAGANVGWIVLIMVLRGVGMGLLVAPVSAALLNSVERHQTATATTVNSLILQLGGSLGVAMSGISYQLLYDHYIDNYSQQTAEHYSLQGSFFIAAVLILLAWIPAWRLPRANPEIGGGAEKVPQ
jgi:DHA2 family multidrug resistance protein